MVWILFFLVGAAATCTDCDVSETEPFSCPSGETKIEGAEDQDACVVPTTTPRAGSSGGARTTTENIGTGRVTTSAKATTKAATSAQATTKAATSAQAITTAKVTTVGLPIGSSMLIGTAHVTQPTARASTTLGTSKLPTTPPPTTTAAPRTNLSSNETLNATTTNITSNTTTPPPIETIAGASSFPVGATVGIAVGATVVVGGTAALLNPVVLKILSFGLVGEPAPRPHAFYNIKLESDAFRNHRVFA